MWMVWVHSTGHNALNTLFSYLFINVCMRHLSHQPQQFKLYKGREESLLSVFNTDLTANFSCSPILEQIVSFLLVARNGCRGSRWSLNMKGRILSCTSITFHSGIWMIKGDNILQSISFPFSVAGKQYFPAINRQNNFCSCPIQCVLSYIYQDRQKKR